MANHKSAQKRIRQSARRTERNSARRSRIRSFVRKAEEAIASGDSGAAETAFRAVMPELQRGVSKGLLHRNTVARKIGRLSRRLRKMGG